MNKRIIMGFFAAVLLVVAGYFTARLQANKPTLPGHVFVCKGVNLRAKSRESVLAGLEGIRCESSEMICLITRVGKNPPGLGCVKI